MDTTNGSSSSSSSSRKGKKNNVSSENSKPRKQPQRGLGVAQLEKIRILHSQLHHHHHQPPPPYFNYNEDPRLLQTPSYSHNSYTFQPHTMASLPEYERSNIRYADSHQPNRWQHGNVNHYSPPQTNTTQPYLNLYDSQDIGMHRSDSLDLESSETQEPDLELRLSLY